MYLGAHASITPTILDALKYIQSISGNAIQIFAGNNKSTALKAKKKLTPEEKDEIKKYLQEYNLYLAIHAIYLLNFCNFPSESMRIKYAQDNLIYDLELAEEIGASCVVLHLGYQKDLSREEAYHNMADNVFLVLKKTNKSAPNVKLALETPAGQGSQICRRVEELGELKDLIYKMINESSLSQSEKKKSKDRLQFCIDTAHIFTSGHDIRNKKLINQYFKDFDASIGLQNCCLLHLNDSRADFNSHRDIHEGIGRGFIFGKDNDEMIPVLSTLMDVCKKNKIPIILETHKAGSPKNPLGELYAQEISLLNRINEYLSKRKKNKSNLNNLQSWELINSDSKKSKKSNKSNKSIKFNSIKKTKKIGKTKSVGKIKKIGKTKSTSKNNNHSFQNTQLTNLPLINKFKVIQEYYNLVEKDRIRGIAYGRAVLALKNYPEEILTGDQVKGLKGIGDKIALKIDQYKQSGEMKIFKELKINEALKKVKLENKNKIESILGFGPSKAKDLKKKGIYTVTDLRKAVKEGKVELNDKESIGLKYHEDLKKMIPRKESEKVFNEFIRQLKSTNNNKSTDGNKSRNNNKLVKKQITENLLQKYKLDCELAGSYPSGKLESKDIDILIICRKYKTLKTLPKKIMDSVVDKLTESGLLIEVLSQGKTNLLGIVKIKNSDVCRHIDIRLLPEESEVSGRLYFTSGRDFNQMIRGRAKQMGFKLSEFGLFDIKTNDRILDITGKDFKNEEKLMERIGLNYIPLEKRR